MIRHNSRKKKLQRKKYAFVASITRAKTVKNNTIPKSDKEFFMIPYSCKNVDTTGKFWFIPGVPGTMFIKNKNPDPSTGNRYSLIDHSWKAEKHPQPKAIVVHNDPKKMNRVEYMEKLVQHKMKKWARAHPCPTNMFEEDVKQWKDNYSLAEERMRDFVISAYTKLPLMARFEVAEGKYTTDYSIKVGELKDKHHELIGGITPIQLDPKKSPLMKKAKQITNSIHAKHANLVAVNLLDHKHKKGCLILPDKKLAA